MKICSRCNAQLDDNASFCTNCGAQFAQQQQQQQQQQQEQYQQQAQYQQYQQAQYQPPQPKVDPYDHTAEFDAKDISENKVISMLCYLLGIFGIFIALLGSNTSKYAAFHVRQALKFLVLETLILLITVVLAWTFIVPIAAVAAYITLFVVKIICFFSICNGKAKEPAIVKYFGFLR